MQSIDEEASNWRNPEPGYRQFFCRRALTLFIAIVSAVGSGCYSGCLNRSLCIASPTGAVPRRCTASLMYAFHAFSTIFIVFTVLDRVLSA
ncbi:MAG: hypothetical protein R3E95_17995 [Thiolinea sp.]